MYIDLLFCFFLIHKRKATLSNKSKLGSEKCQLRNDSVCLFHSSLDDYTSLRHPSCDKNSSKNYKSIIDIDYGIK